MTTRTLFKDLKVGQSLSIDGGRIVVTLEQKSGQLAKLKFVHDGASIEALGPERPASQALMGVKAG